MELNREELLKLEKTEAVDVLLAVIKQLTEKIAELEGRINQNSSNSSIPPSKDRPGNKPKPISQRDPSGKKPGGQKGHAGSSLNILQEPSEIVEHHPVECANCANAGLCNAQRIVSNTRYEIDIIVETTTKAHQTMQVECPNTGTKLLGHFPEHIRSSIQYGISLAALATTLNTEGAVSINRTHEILGSVFNIPVSTGTIANMVTNCAQIVSPRVEEIKEVAKVEPQLNLDETGVNVGGENHWAHVASTKSLTYIDVHPKRGKAAMHAIGILLVFLGTIIHDCWTAYFSFDGLRHSLCNAHLLRELKAVVENTKQQWAENLIKLLLKMKEHKENLLLKGINSASDSEWEKFSSEYDKILDEALLHNPILPREDGSNRKPKRGKTGALVDRLILRKAQYLLFFTDFDVPFDNNQAERDIRMFKTKEKVSGCFRTLDGAKDYATIMSYTSTARKNGVSAYKAIRDALLGRPFSVKTLSLTE